MSSQGGEGQKLPILTIKKTIKGGGGGQKSPILRRHSLWTAPNMLGTYTGDPRLVRIHLVRSPK